MKISFIIPFHNEEKNVEPMLDQVMDYAKKKKWNYEIIAVNDRSTDHTYTVLQKFAKKHSHIKPYHRKHGAGGEQLGNTIGRALHEGSMKASGDILIWTMGDLSDDVETYGSIVEKIKQGYDMVFGSRYIPGGTWGSLDPTKAFLSSRGTVLARWFFKIPVHDITNAFRGFRKKLIEEISLESSGFSISPEFAIKAHMDGYKLSEVPTVYHTRTEGESKFKLWKMAREYLKIYFYLLIKRRFGPN